MTSNSQKFCTKFSFYMCIVPYTHMSITHFRVQILCNVMLNCIRDVILSSKHFKHSLKNWPLYQPWISHKIDGVICVLLLYKDIKFRIENKSSILRCHNQLYRYILSRLKRQLQFQRRTRLINCQFIFGCVHLRIYLTPWSFIGCIWKTGSPPRTPSSIEQQWCWVVAFWTLKGHHNQYILQV